MNILGFGRDPRKLSKKQELIDENQRLQLIIENYERDRNKFNELCSDGTIVVQIRADDGRFTKRLTTLDEFI